MAAKGYTKALTVSQTSKTTTIAELVMKDEDPQRSIDYLRTLVNVYNRQTNEDKNEISFRTEQFINQRLRRSTTNWAIQKASSKATKKRNNVVEMKLNATAAIANSDIRPLRNSRRLTHRLNF